jgi:protein gp37
MKMADKSKIEWLDGGSTWNPAVGCSKVSAGCRNCYAHRMISTRFPHLTGVVDERIYDHSGTVEDRRTGIGWDGDAHFKPERLEIPFHWKKPRRIFVCSMSDLFHESLTDEQIAAVFGVMAATPQHQYVILTKRLERAKYWFSFVGATANHYGQAESVICMDNMLRLGATIDTAQADIVTQRERWPLENVIICASVENQPAVDERASLLFQIPARWRGVSVEPMLEGIDVRKYIGCDCEEFWPGQGHPPDCPTQTGQILNLVICGAETGPGKRPFKDEWALDLRNQCKAAGTPFFFKKDGSGKPTLCGVEYHEWPED